jgi:hypothetical protein
MKPSELFEALNGLIDCRLPCMIWGPPGIGKSEIVAQVATHRKVELRDVRLGLMDPTDIKGFPSPDHTKKQMHWLPPDFLPTKGKGVLFLDEINTAPPAVQAASYQLILNRKVGNYELPAGWDIVAAGNRATDQAVVHNMGTALMSRLIHLTLEADVEEWASYAERNGISSITVAFIKFRKELLHKMDPKLKGQAFPCPRTWFFLDRLITKTKMRRHVLLEVASGTVGEGPAREYQAFAAIASELPSVEEILADPLKIRVSQEPSVLYAVTDMLARSTTEKNFGQMMKYIGRITKEFQVIYIRDVLRKNDKLRYDPIYTKWGHENHDVFTGT